MSRNRFKRSARSILAGLLVLCLSLSGLLSCGTPGSGEPARESGTAETSVDPVVSSVDPESEEAPVLRTLAQNGELLFRIFYPRQGSDFEQSAAEELGEVLGDLAGGSIEVLSDVALYEEERLDIYVGNTRYPESAEVLSEIGYGDYALRTVGNKIVVAATQSSALKAAIRVLLAAIRGVSADGVVSYPENAGTTVTLIPLLSAIPKIGTSSLKSWTIAENSSYTMASSGVGEEQYTAYLDKLQAAGFICHAEKTVSDNLFATYGNGQAAVNVSYYPLKRTFHVTVDSLEYTALPEKAVGTFTRLCTTQLSMLGCSANAKNDNGLSLFFRLPDGRFLIWDGGGNEPVSDAANLYEKLCASAGEAGVEKIVVAGWFLTHCHGDHAYVYQQFCRAYTDRVTVEQLIFCPNARDYGPAVSDGIAIETNTMTLTRTKYPQAKIVIARAGQTFLFPDVRVDVLFTLDAMMPYAFNDYNASSVVCMVTVGDKKILITGDSQTDSINFLTDVYGDELHCDYLQVPHHGAIPGGTVKAYRTIQPGWLLWPAGPLTFESVLSDSYDGSSINHYLLEDMGMAEKMTLAGSLGDIFTVTFAETEE